MFRILNTVHILFLMKTLSMNIHTSVSACACSFNHAFVYRVLIMFIQYYRKCYMYIGTEPCESDMEKTSCLFCKIVTCTVNKKLTHPQITLIEMIIEHIIIMQLAQLDLLYVSHNNEADILVS